MGSAKGPSSVAPRDGGSVVGLLLQSIRLIAGCVTALVASFYRKLSRLLASSQPTFDRLFEGKYGPSHPKFFGGSLNAAKSAAFREGRLLAVYIHSERDDHVCASILSNSLLIEVLDANCLFYVEHLKGPRLRHLIQVLGAVRLPHLSLLAMRNHSDFSVVARIEDFSSVDAVVGTVVGAIENPTRVVRPIGDDLRDSRRLMSEQDAEFRRAVEVDTARMREKAQRESEELRHRKLKEAQAQKREELVRERRAFATKFRASRSVGDTKIKVRLPSGRTLESVFRRDDSVDTLYQWVGAAEYFSSSPVKIPFEFELSIPHPSKPLRDRAQTLEAAQLFPNASLILISRDDSDESDA